MRKAPLLILDEPTSSLDAENRRAVLTALHEISAGRTTFMITHELSEIRNADLILYIEEGVLVEKGTHEDLMTQQGGYAKLVSQSFSGEKNVA